MSSEWRVFIANTLDGQIVADVEPIELPSFERKINDKGSLSVPVYVDNEAHAVDLRTYTQPGKYTWVLAYGTYIAQAGPVWSYTFSHSDRKLTVACGGLFSIFARRVLRNPNGSANDPVKAIVNESEDLVYNNLSLRGIMRQIVADTLAQNYSGLPLVLPEAEPGTATRTYYGYELAMVDARMTELSEVQDGPEFDFAPEFTETGDHIQWRLNIGGPTLGDQGSDAVWDLGGAMETIDIDSNGSASPCTRVWVKGAGSDRALLTGFAEDLTLVQQGYPSVDYVDTSHSSATEQDTLEAWADADLAQFANPVETWTSSIRIDGSSRWATTGSNGSPVEIAPTLGSWALGDAPTIFVDNHPWLPNGGYRRRILGFSNDTESTVKLELAPMSTPSY